MYSYDDFDEAFVRERVAQFRGQVERRIEGRLTEDEFRPLRLMNGLYLQLHAELPYASAVETEKYEERRDGSVAIHQQILVARDSQRAIVLGKRGARIKELGAAARAELERLLERKVHLFLHVKVKPDWEEDRSLYREIGLDWVE